MKKFIAFYLLTLICLGCDSSAPQPVANTNVSTPNNSNTTTVLSHSTEKTKPDATNVSKSESKTKWTQSGDPIDTTKFDTAIAEAEKNLKAKPTDEAAKKELANAYLQRGTALTEARQYASALGDYRRVLKYDASNQEAKTWIQQIIDIYEGLNKEYPKEGEEPPPLKAKK